MHSHFAGMVASSLEFTDFGRNELSHRWIVIEFESRWFALLLRLSAQCLGHS
jgi:hypothetical protein